MNGNNRTNQKRFVIPIITLLLTAINIWLIRFFSKYPQTGKQIVYLPFFAKYYIHFYILFSVTIIGLILYWTILTTRQKIKPVFRILRLLLAVVFVVLFALVSFAFPIFTHFYTHLDTATYAGNTYYLGLHREEFDSIRQVVLGKCSTKHSCEFEEIRFHDFYRYHAFLTLDVSDDHLIIDDGLVTSYTLDADDNICLWGDETRCHTIFEQ